MFNCYSKRAVNFSSLIKIRLRWWPPIPSVYFDCRLVYIYCKSLQSFVALFDPFSPWMNPVDLSYGAESWRLICGMTIVVARLSSILTGPADLGTSVSL